MLPIQQPWEHEAAYRKGYQKGLVTGDPARMITVNLSSFSVRPDTLGIPRWISFSTQQDTSVHDVLTEIHRRLPDIPYPFTVSTLGANPQELGLDDSSATIMDLLPTYDAAVLSLRLNIELPKPDKEPKKSLGARLRNALGAGDSRSGGSLGGQTDVQSNPTEGAASRVGVRSAPPPYEEAVRTTP